MFYLPPLPSDSLKGEQLTLFHAGTSPPGARGERWLCFHRRNFFIYLLVFFSFHSANAQQSTWTTSYEPAKSFIENRSQFDGKNNLTSDSILFGTEGTAQFYFTKSGLTIRLDAREKKQEEEREEEKTESAKDYREREKEEHTFIYKSDLIQVEWLGANPDVEVYGEDVVPDYFCYTIGEKNINNVKAYKKIIYKNLYPGIDVKYVFHPSGSGIKYSITLHPGADVSKLKMKYSDRCQVDMDSDGNIMVSTIFGNIVDHAPVSFYQGDNKKIILSYFVQRGNEILFWLYDYDNTKTIIIDPWTVVPSMPNSNKVWEIEADSLGNAYIYGGDWPNCKLQKYNTAGALQWTNITAGYDSSAWIGTLATDLAGNCYVTIGSTAAIKKVNPAGATQWNNPGGIFDEYWSLAFNCDYTQLVCGGTRLVGLISFTGDGKIFNIDMNNGNVLNNATVAYTIPSFIINDINEVRSICASPNGNFYFHTLDTIGELTPAFGINWRLLTSYSYAYGSPNYGFTPQPQHVIRTTGNYIYTMNGATIFRRDISTGAVINQAAIPGGSFATPLFVQGIAPRNNGIAIDSCGNVYVGSVNQVHKFDATLSLISSAAVPNAVYDVAVGRNGEVLACGQSFAASVNMSACNPPQAICATSTLNASASGTNILCFGDCTGSATATPVGGTPTYSYLWSGSQTTQTINNLCAGTYTVTITDGSGNTATATVVITQPSSAVTATTSSTNATCNSSNGSVSVNASGGTGAYSYSWAPTGDTTTTVNNLPGGVYTITVTDINGCTFTASVTVNVTGAPSLTITAQVNVLCVGDSTGQATVNASGGSAPYTYSWSTVPVQTSATAAGLSAGTYSVTVTDSLGCAQTVSVTITQPPPFGLAISQVNVLCHGDSTGSASIGVSGGTAPYSYVWTPGGDTTFSISNISSGIYIVLITDSNGCTVSFGFSISEPPQLSVSATSTDVLCFGDSNGTASANVSGGTPAYSYLWTPGSWTTFSVSNLSAGNYIVAITDSNGCTTQDTVLINSPTQVSAAIAVTNGCGTNGSAAVTASGGTTAYSYLWSPTGDTANSVSGLISGTYTCTVTDANGCTQSVSSIITNFPAPVISVGSDVTINIGDSTVLSAAGGGTYLWTPSAGLNCTTCSSPTASPSATTYYCVTVTDTNGCSDSACVRVTVDIECGDVFVPSAFSPNNDLMNDLECVYGRCIATMIFSVYNRWGEKVFESTDLKNCWDGKYKGEDAGTGVYAYTLEATLVTGEKISLKGNVSLVR